jgi:hypothetical protein
MADGSDPSLLDRLKNFIRSFQGQEQAAPASEEQLRASGHGFAVWGFALSAFVPQPIMPLDLPVKVRSWELTVCPRSHIRRWLRVTWPAQARM